MNLIERLHHNYLFAVIRGSSAVDAIEISKAAIMGESKILKLLLQRRMLRMQLADYNFLIRIKGLR